MIEKIKTLIEKLERIARLTERNTFPMEDGRVLNTAVWFKNMTTYQKNGVKDMISNFRYETDIGLKFWIDENCDNDFNLLIKY